MLRVKDQQQTKNKKMEFEIKTETKLFKSKTKTKTVFFGLKTSLVHNTSIIAKQQTRQKLNSTFSQPHILKKMRQKTYNNKYIQSVKK